MDEQQTGNDMRTCVCVHVRVRARAQLLSFV